MTKESARRAIIYVFSGTGNTFLAAQATAASLKERGIDTEVFRIKKPFSAAPDPRDYDIAGFGYPIHAFNAPQFFLRFIDTLPKTRGMPAFIFKTSGEPFSPNNASSYWLNKKLRAKGYCPGTDMHMLMPYNIMFRYPPALAKQMYHHTLGMADKLAAQIAEDDLSRPHYNPFTVIWAAIFRIQWVGAWLNGPLIRAKKDLCTGCGRCARECPAQNISIKDGVAHFSRHCTMCMNCATSCPRDAIRPGFLTHWRVNGGYDFSRLSQDSSIADTYINQDTKGYFRSFREYYLKNKV